MMAVGTEQLAPREAVFAGLTYVFDRQFWHTRLLLSVWVVSTYLPGPQLVSAVHTFFLQVVRDVDSYWLAVQAGLQLQLVPHS
jgi:hypothetical protein